MKLNLFVSAVVASVLSASVASAALVGVDFESGLGGTPTNRTSVHGSGTHANLINETGAITPITLTVLNPSVLPQGISGGTVPAHANALSGLDSMNVSSHPFALSGLTPNGAYDFWLFGLHDGVGSLPSFRANVQGASLVQLDFVLGDGAAGDLFINGVLGSSGNTLGSYSQLVTASNIGTIDVSFSNVVHVWGEIGVAGFALQQVPEPASAALLGLGGLALLLRRRRSEQLPESAALGLVAFAATALLRRRRI
jgi:hypothetical protein